MLAKLNRNKAHFGEALFKSQSSVFSSLKSASKLAFVQSCVCRQQQAPQQSNLNYFKLGVAHLHNSGCNLSLISGLFVGKFGLQRRASLCARSGIR